MDAVTCARDRRSGSWEGTEMWDIGEMWLSLGEYRVGVCLVMKFGRRCSVGARDVAVENHFGRSRGP